MSKRKSYTIYLHWSGYSPSSGEMYNKELDPATVDEFCRRLAARATKVNGRPYDCHAEARNGL